MAPIVVTPAELKTAANHIRRAHLYATQQIAGFGLVRDNGGAAGTDNAARKFCTDYDPAARDAADAATSYVIALGQFHDLLQATAANHDNANKLSVIGGAPNDLAFPPGSIAWMPRPEVPALFGGGVEPPSLWSQISGYVQGELWPNGDVEKLRNVATGWSNPGHELSANKFQLAQAREALGNQQTPELQQILDQLAILEAENDAVCAQLTALGKACADYALALETTRAAITRALAEFGALFVVGEAAGIALSQLSFGGSIAGVNAALAARASVVGARIAATIRAFVTAAEACAVPTIAASAASARSIAALTPLMTAQISLFSAEFYGLVTPITKTDMTLLSRRPYLRKSTKDAVIARANTEIVNGQEFYISATNSKVLIPKSGTYDDPAITQLPKDPRGEYYQAPNGIKYPVNSTPVFGHVRGSENWWLRDEALRRNPPMTWKEYCDHWNDPKHFQIEDAPGNARHTFEAPR